MDQAWLTTSDVPPHPKYLNWGVQDAQSQAETDSRHDPALNQGQQLSADALVAQALARILCRFDLEIGGKSGCRVPNIGSSYVSAAHSRSATAARPANSVQEK